METSRVSTYFLNPREHSLISFRNIVQKKIWREDSIGRFESVGYIRTDEPFLLLELRGNVTIECKILRSNGVIGTIYCYREDLFNILTTKQLEV